MVRTTRPAAPANQDRWLISYADFITLLLAVFVVMFASSQPDKSKARQVSFSVSEALGGNQIPSPKSVRSSLAPPKSSAIPKSVATPGPVALAEAKTEVPSLVSSMTYLHAALADEIRDGKVDVHLESTGLVISLRQAAYFPSGGDEIATSGLDSLGKIAGTIRELPNPVRLEGHTDSAPIHTRRFRSNWELSAARGIAMLQLFEGRYRIPVSRFAVAGYAETKPVDSNDSAEGRAHNRRVDIVILSRQPS